jgi:dienelactone hydrolase
VLLHGWEGPHTKKSPRLTFSSSGKIGSMGFCWGSWAIGRAAGKPGHLACGVCAHPSFHIQMIQKSGPTMDEMFKEMQAPLLVCPAWNDPSSTREGGYYMNILKENPLANKSKSVLFNSQMHGFANRANITVPQNRRDCERFMRLSLEFFHEHLLGSEDHDSDARL